MCGKKFIYLSKALIYIYQLLRLLMEGKIEGRRGLGRRKCSWLKNIGEWTGLDTCTLLRAARNREEFAGIVADLQ